MSEAADPVPRVEPKDVGTVDVAAGGTFEIYLAWSDKTILVARDQSALQVLLDAGVPIEPGCQTGGCGDCATQYVEGDVIHKDCCLNASDRAHTFCPCVSRAKTRIVLAL